MENFLTDKTKARNLGKLRSISREKFRNSKINLSCQLCSAKQPIIIRKPGIQNLQKGDLETSRCWTCHVFVFPGQQEGDLETLPGLRLVKYLFHLCSDLVLGKSQKVDKIPQQWCSKHSKKEARCK